jgi:hypothetical protein
MTKTQKKPAGKKRDKQTMIREEAEAGEMRNRRK